jgi:hypothetical protein
MRATLQPNRPARLVPILELLDPHDQTRTILVLLAAGVAAAAVGMRWWGVQLWVATVAVLLLLLPPAVRKWREDLRRFGETAMVMSVLLAMQGFHSIEHAAQLIEYHLLGWPMRTSSGLISAANAEWVHFVWNWIVLLVVGYLVIRGVRNPWAWLLLAWSFAHTLEHTYLFVRYIAVLDELGRIGAGNVPAQGLPGIFGRDGWLATSTVTQGSFLCRLPGITTVVRLDVHFWWNTGETLLMILAANSYCARALLPRMGRRFQTRTTA